jgi:hypothetical protein
MKDVDGRDKPGHDDRGTFSAVMPGLVPGIHVLYASDIASVRMAGHDEPGPTGEAPTSRFKMSKSQFGVIARSVSDEAIQTISAEKSWIASLTLAMTR